MKNEAKMQISILSALSMFDCILSHLASRSESRLVCGDISTDVKNNKKIYRR